MGVSVSVAMYFCLFLLFFFFTAAAVVFDVCFRPRVFV